MPSAWPFPCRIKDTGTGDFYYFDGVHPPTILTGGVGTDLNSVFGNVASFEATTAQRQNIQTYFLARDAVFAQLAACESCPDGLAKSERDLDGLIDAASAEHGVE